MRVLLALVLLLSCCHERAGGSPPAPSPDYDTSCQHDWQCTPAPSCCVAPCSSNVINEREAARAKKEFACDPDEHCPVAGGCPTFAYLCVRNQCALVLSDSPDFRQRDLPPPL